MSRGPNPKRVGESEAWFSQTDRAGIESRYGQALSDETWRAVLLAMWAFEARLNEAGLPSVAEYHRDLDGAISSLEVAMDAVWRVITFDRANDDLPRLYSKLEWQYGEYRKCRGDWPEIESGEQSYQVMSVSEVKKQTVRRLVEIADGAGLDPKKLVEACDIHHANSMDAWLKWYDRTKL